MQELQQQGMGKNVDMHGAGFDILFKVHVVHPPICICI
jgi:hypothetical protein